MTKTDTALDILLIRHGQTDWNAAGRWQGRADIPLNATGVAQAEALAARLRTWPIQAIYSSQLSRARVTAETIAAVHSLPVTIEPLWQERDAGDFSGMNYAEIRARVGTALGALDSPPNGETLAQVLERGRTAYENVLNAHPTGMVAVVSHGNILALLISHLLGIPAEHNRRFSMGNNTGLSRVRVEKGVARIHLLNCAAHLE